MGKKRKVFKRMISAPVTLDRASETIQLLVKNRDPVDYSSYKITEKRLPKISQLDGVHRLVLQMNGRQEVRKLASQLNTVVREEDEEALEESSIPFTFFSLESRHQEKLLGARLVPKRGFIVHHSEDERLEYLVADLPRQRVERKILGKLLNPMGVEVYKLVPLDLRGREWSLEKAIKKWDEKEVNLILRRKTDHLLARVWDLCRGRKSRGIYWIYMSQKPVIKFTEMRRGDEVYRVDFSRSLDGDTYSKTIGLGISLILAIHESQFTDGLSFIMDEIAEALKSPNDSSSDLADEIMQLI